MEFKEKRHIANEGLKKLIDFTFNIVNKLHSENKKHLNQIVQLAVDKMKYL
uniref:Uncharacterized protein n=1 Tax=Rhizophagus irregularis (strain DAOM 181602 / DAOM 197198 / MUCL 43194) TaxID=747089 RepID=U9TAC1_RHIID